MNFEDPEQRFPLKESKHSDFVLFVGRRLLEDVDSTNPNAQNESLGEAQFVSLYTHSYHGVLECS